MKPDEARLALIIAAAEAAGDRQCFEFSLGALKVALNSCGPLRGNLVLALETSMRSFRGECLTLPAMTNLTEEDAKLGNAAYRDSIATNLEQLARALRDV